MRSKWLKSARKVPYTIEEAIAVGAAVDACCLGLVVEVGTDGRAGGVDARAAHAGRVDIVRPWARHTGRGAWPGSEEGGKEG